MFMSTESFYVEGPNVDSCLVDSYGYTVNENLTIRVYLYTFQVTFESGV